MDHYTHFVGIDVSKHTLDVMLWHLDQGTLGKTACQTSNDAPGHQQLVQGLTEQGARLETTVLCLEHTGRYDDALLEHLTLRGWICALEKTTVLQKVKPEHHRKDDSFDADLLATPIATATSSRSIRPVTPRLSRFGCFMANAAAW